MAIVCLNCDSEIPGNFCGNCGQSAKVHKINFHFLIHDIQHGLLHIEKGFLYTIKELFSRPGHSIREFLAGKRVNHFKPLSFVIILAGIYGILTNYFDLHLFSTNFQISGSGESYLRSKEVVDKMSKWISQHYSIVAIIQIPIFAFGTYICFLKSGYNFLEHIIINAFITGQKLTLRLISFPLFYYYRSNDSFRIVTNIIEVISYVFAAWTLWQLFSKINPVQRIFRTLLSFITSMLIFIFLLLIVAQIVLNS
jgi:hypothetical protein